MANSTPKLGFSYFSSQEYRLDRHLHTWLPALQKWGASNVIFTANFELAIPEDVFIFAQNHGLEPIIHFDTTLPSARSFNDTAFLLEIYRKWGTKYVILGDKPNTKQGWQSAGWHDDTLVESFLDCFIPMANQALKLGMKPIMAPLEPGGDYWDCAFLELILGGLQKRKLSHILEALILSSYGYIYQKPISWGAGGPERWPGSKPYHTPEGQEDQLGFHNFEWAQAASQRVIGKKMPVIVLDAGAPGPIINQVGKIDETLHEILTACNQPYSEGDWPQDPVFNDQVLACFFSLETIHKLKGTDFSLEALDQVFSKAQTFEGKTKGQRKSGKHFDHYLLLPAYDSGVSDVVLNKVRPVIKKFRPTVGFSLQDASYASKVSIFPDPLFTDEQINLLRASGCEVEILPKTGIEIATLLQD